MINEIVPIAIALLSLTLSIYVILRDRKYRKYDHLYNCRQRIFDIFYNHQALTPEELEDFFDANPDSDKAQKHKAISSEISFRLDREFEFACYLVIKKQIDLNSFLDLFRGFLLGRLLMWKEWKQNNYPYTWKLICLCEKKGLLTVKKRADDA